MQIKRCVTDGKGPSSRRSVTVRSRAAHSISAAKWVNRVRSVQLPPRCRGIGVGIERGGTGVFGVRWICLSIRWFECQFVSTAAPKIREKKLETPPKRASKMGPAVLPANLGVATSVCIGCNCVADQAALSSALTPCQRRPFPLFLLGA